MSIVIKGIDMPKGNKTKILLIYSDGRVFTGIKDDIDYFAEELPSAQPEIIQCKECKHSKEWYKDKRRCFLWHEEGIDVFEDGYCNYAKRRMRGEQYD